MVQASHAGSPPSLNGRSGKTLGVISDVAHGFSFGALINISRQLNLCQVGWGEGGREDSPEHHKILAASLTSVHQMPGASSHPSSDSRTAPGPLQVYPKRRPNLPQERITDLLGWISSSKMDSLFLGVSTYFVGTTLTQVCLYKLISPWGLTHLARTTGSPAKVWIDSGSLC